MPSFQAHATAGQTVFPIPAGLIPSGCGLRVDSLGQPVKYSLTSGTSVTLAAPCADRQVVNFEAVTLGDLTREAVLDFPSIAAASQASLTVTVPGAAVGDVVTLGLPAAPAAGITWDVFVSAADTVTVRASNITGSAVDPASATYRIIVSKA